MSPTELRFVTCEKPDGTRYEQLMVRLCDMWLKCDLDARVQRMARRLANDSECPLIDQRKYIATAEQLNNHDWAVCLSTVDRGNDPERRSPFPAGFYIVTREGVNGICILDGPFNLCEEPAKWDFPPLIVDQNE